MCWSKDSIMCISIPSSFRHIYAIFITQLFLTTMALKLSNLQSFNLFQKVSKQSISAWLSFLKVETSFSVVFSTAR